MMLSKLLPTGRWRLLKALWLDNASGSVQALSKQYEMSYSSAHMELKRLEQALLARSEYVGNSLVFEANKTHSAAHAVEDFVRASADEVSPEEGHPPLQVMAKLALLGAPVSVGTTQAADLTLEEAVAQGLRLTHYYPNLARAYPVLLAR